LARRACGEHRRATRRFREVAAAATGREDPAAPADVALLDDEPGEEELVALAPLDLDLELRPELVGVLAGRPRGSFREGRGVLGEGGAEPGEDLLEIVLHGPGV
jgi:hypothetical protein